MNPGCRNNLLQDSHSCLWPIKTSDHKSNRLERLERMQGDALYWPDRRLIVLNRRNRRTPPKVWPVILHRCRACLCKRSIKALCVAQDPRSVFGYEVLSNCVVVLAIVLRDDAIGSRHGHDSLFTICKIQGKKNKTRG
jgi:hypothetical protein